MLINPGGGSSGFSEYLEHGQKKGRDMHRDVLDERIPLYGDLALFDMVVDRIERDGQKYLHFTISFLEDYVSPEVLRAATKEFMDFAMSAYRPDEYTYYAEVHKPRVLSYHDAKEGKLIIRKPHIHIGIPDTNLRTGDRLEPFGVIERNHKYIDAFQEDFNARYGSYSPKDSPRLDGASMTDMLTRYGKQELLGQRHTEMKASIAAEIVSGEIKDFDGLKARLAEIGKVHTSNIGNADREWLKVTPHGEDRAIRFKSVVFSPDFLSKPPAERRQLVEEIATTKYREVQQAKKAPEHTGPILAEWHSIRARELRFLRNDLKNPDASSAFYREEYKDADPATKEKHLDRLQSEHTQRSQRNGNEYQHQPHDYDRARIPPPTARGRLRDLSELDVAHDAEGAQVLLPDDVRRILDERKQRQESARDSLRRGSDGDTARDGISPQPSSVIAGMRRDLDESQQRRAAAPDIADVKANLDAGRVLEHLAHSHGLDPDKYSIEKGKDGSDRIRAGSRAYPVNDFLTKEMGLPWREAAPLLKRLYAEQQREQEREQGHEPKGREEPRRDLWREFQDKQKGNPTRSEQWAEQRASEKARREQIKQTFRQAKDAAYASHMQPNARRAALSIARMEKVQAEAALRETVKREQAELKASMSKPEAEKYREFLAELAKGGDEQALAELRRMSPPRRGHDDEGDGITAAMPPDQPKAPIHQAPAYRHKVSDNGDVTYQRDGQDVLRDTGGKVQMLMTDKATIETGLRLAVQKFGTTLKLEGSRAFQEQAARVAAEAGLRIEFTDPSLNKIMADHRDAVIAERAQAGTRREAEKGGNATDDTNPVQTFDTPTNDAQGERRQAPTETVATPVQATPARPTTTAQDERKPTPQQQPEKPASREGSGEPERQPTPAPADTEQSAGTPSTPTPEPMDLSPWQRFAAERNQKIGTAADIHEHVAVTPTDARRITQEPGTVVSYRGTRDTNKQRQVNTVLLDVLHRDTGRKQTLVVPMSKELHQSLKAAKVREGDKVRLSRDKEMERFEVLERSRERGLSR